MNPAPPPRTRTVTELKCVPDLKRVPDNKSAFLILTLFSSNFRLFHVTSFNNGFRNNRIVLDSSFHSLTERSPNMRMMAVGRRLGNILNSCCFIAVHPKEDEKVEEDNSSSEIQELGEPVKGYVEEAW